MIENLVIISIIGFLVGIIITIPAGGSVSIVIFTNALSGRLSYCHRVTFGASMADFTYVFISTYGMTKLYSLYQPYIPYILLIGAALVIYLSLKIFKSKLGLGDETPPGPELDKDENAKRNGFLTGMMLGYLNPGLFMSSMMSSFIVFSWLTALGFDTAGLDQKMGRQLDEVHTTIPSKQDSASTLLMPPPTILNRDMATVQPAISNKNYPVLLSGFYALALTVGGISWFYYAAYLLGKYRTRIRQKTVTNIIRVLGIALFVLGLVFAYKGVLLLI